MQLANGLKFLLLLCYIFVAVSITYILAIAFSLVTTVPEYVIWLTMAGFIFVCISGVYWLSPLMMLFMNVRKPIREEEKILTESINILKQKTGDKRNYRLRIIETNELSAFAFGVRTIAVSKGLMQILEKEELIAIMAHEMAHLRARDTFAGTGLFIAFYIPARIQAMSINFVLRFSASFLRQAIMGGIVASILGVVLLMGIAYYFHFFTWIIAFIVLGLLFLLINRIFKFLYLADSRFTEYRRDAFAQQLGYGSALKTSLIKLIELAPSSHVSFWYVFFKSTHPVTHNRIRKLEKNGA